MRYLISIAVTSLLLFASATTFAVTDRERSAAINGCKTAILDGAVSDYARRAGLDRSELGPGFKQELVAKIQAKRPDFLSTVESNCACMIDYFIEEEGTLSAMNNKQLVQRHKSAMLKACPPPAFR